MIHFVRLVCFRSIDRSIARSLARRRSGCSSSGMAAAHFGQPLACSPDTCTLINTGWLAG
eukprot:m.92850 g.92850  ORF g.92850 m.92850 type:complete len:60 (+) comp15076_c2_seq3:109-288(+)